MTSKKKVLKKEYGAAASTKPGMKKKAPAKRVPMSKVRASTHETMEFTLDPREEEAAGGKKRKERVKKTMARVIGKPSMVRESEEEEEEEPVAPAVKSQKLMGDAIRTGAAPSKPKSAPSLQLKLKLQDHLHPRDPPRTYLLLRRTRPQCLKFKMRKSPKCSESLNQRFQIMMTINHWLTI